MNDRQARRATAHDLAASSPDRIRNVVLVGPSGAGKTTLIEGLLAAGGAITRVAAEDTDRQRRQEVSPVRWRRAFRRDPSPPRHRR